MRSKIKVANLPKVGFALQKKEFLRISGEMKDPKLPGGDAADATVPFFFKKEHEFSCGTTHPLLIIGAKNPAWKKEAKEAFKENKKGMLFGNCYIQGDTLFLQVQKGNMKLVDLKKGAKMLLKKVGVSNVGICQGVTKDDTGSSDNKETAKDAKSADPKLAAKRAKGKHTLRRMRIQLERIMERLKI
ncbi:MAG: hypothetical protein MK212_19105 [Saprospiraceae bacterium]|nr:hypothetical protein [Saprospiraceae bacterium]